MPNQTDVSHKVNNGQAISLKSKLGPEDLQLLAEKVLHYFSQKRETINKINVFPVADGDTGTNIELTLRGALDYVNESDISVLTLDGYLQRRLKGMILSSRGCSGSILSLYFKGFVEGLDLKDLSNQKISEALRKGYESAYKGTVDPREGTILTIMKEFYERYKEFSDLESPMAIVKKVLPYLEEAVKETPEKLQILKEAGVVDSGALGFYVLLEGLVGAFYGEISAEGQVLGNVSTLATTKVKESLVKTIGGIKGGFFMAKDVVVKSYEATVNYLRPEKSLGFLTELIKKSIPGKRKGKAWNKGIKFRYCTEFLLDPDKAVNEKEVHKKLEEFGDEVFVINSGGIFKIHVHTNKPEEVLNVFKKIGHIQSIKIDDMYEQRKVLLSGLSPETHYEKDYAILLILNGEGFAEIVKSLGVTDVLVYGEVKPSVLEIMKAIDDVKSKNLIVAVDDNDILMALKIASDLLKSKFNIELIETNNIISILNMLYHSLGSGDVHKDAEAMREAVNDVDFVKVSVATKSMNKDGVAIKKGNFFAIYNNKIILSSANLNKLLKGIVDKVGKGKNLVTLYSGQKEKKRGEKAVSYLRREFDGVEFELYYGGQNKYNYYLVFE